MSRSAWFHHELSGGVPGADIEEMPGGARGFLADLKGFRGFQGFLSSV